MAGFSKSRSGPAKVIWRNMDGRLGVAKLVDRMQLQQKDTAVETAYASGLTRGRQKRDECVGFYVAHRLSWSSASDE